MTLSLALDILLVVLLAASIGYAMVLNRKIGGLNRHKEDLEKLATTFIDSTTRAEDSIQRLKGTTTQLQAGIDKADGLREDMKFLLDRGTATADRLEGAIRRARDLDDGSTAPTGGPVEKSVGIETIADVAPESAFGPEMTGNNPFSSTNDGMTEGDTNEDVSREQAERDLIEALRQVR